MSAATTQGANTFRRSSGKCYFDDEDMDLIFQWALGMAKTGGLDSGELFFVASRIQDGDPRSWSSEFETYGDAQQALADRWAAARQPWNAAETRMKAYASFR
jgi:hypothetical protein